MLDFKSFTHRAKKEQDIFDVKQAQLKIHAYQKYGLHFWLYRYPQPLQKIIVMYHGGGVHSHAGYQFFALRACQENVAICLVDIRGHGQSKKAAKLKDASQIWEDVDCVLTQLKQDFPDTTFELWGHSSGAGMLLNYLSLHQSKYAIEHVVLLAPEFGPFSDTAKQQGNAIAFADVHTKWFILHALFGKRFFAQKKAVKLNYPVDILEQNPEFVIDYTVCMANALTPRHPKKQLKQLKFKTTVCIATEDELFDTQKMMQFCIAAENENIKVECISTTHLEIIFDAMCCMCHD